MDIDTYVFMRKSKSANNYTSMFMFYAISLDDGPIQNKPLYIQHFWACVCVFVHASMYLIR